MPSQAVDAAFAQQSPALVVPDSLRSLSEQAVAAVDSAQRVAEGRLHAVQDSVVAAVVSFSSISSDWMSVFIGALGVLFAAGAIIAAFLLWRQGSEFKQQREQLLADTRAGLDEALAQRNQAFDEWRASLERRAAEILGGTLVTGEKITAKQIEDPPTVAALDELRSDIARLDALVNRDVLRRRGHERGSESLFVLHGVPRGDVERFLMGKFRKKNSSMRWEIVDLPPADLLLSSSYHEGSPGAEDLLKSLQRDFGDKKVTPSAKAAP